MVGIEGLIVPSPKPVPNEPSSSSCNAVVGERGRGGGGINGGGCDGELRET